VKATAKKTKSRRGKAAFFRIGCVAAFELGTHGPLAVRIGEAGESEGVLAAGIVNVFKEDDLLIADPAKGGTVENGLLDLWQLRDNHILC
jgi:hypothetical protein